MESAGISQRLIASSDARALLPVTGVEALVKLTIRFQEIALVERRAVDAELTGQCGFLFASSGPVRSENRPMTFCKA